MTTEADRARRAELLRSLGRVARGLSMLFWGLPLTFAAQLETARSDWFSSASAWASAPGIALNVALLYGLGQLRHFQKQERIWQNALTRAEVLGLMNTGLAPFVFWWHRFPQVPYFRLSVGLLALCQLLFVMQINRVMQRLTAMIPDEALRSETKVFTAFNMWLLGAVFVGLSVWFGANELMPVSARVQRVFEIARTAGTGVGLFLTLFPLALTMALLWKIKEVVFSGVFNSAS